MANDMSSCPLHLLLLPLSPAQGHLIPMLALAERLLAEGCIITCVLTEQSHRAMVDAGGAEAATAPSTRLHFVTVPGAFPESINRREDRLLPMLSAMKEQQGFLERLIEGSVESKGSPISCIITDMTLHWAIDVAKKFGISCAIFWACSATILHIGRFAEAGGLHHREPVELSKLQRKLHIGIGPMLDLFPQEDPEKLKLRMSCYRRLNEASHILINTFDSLEGHILELLPPNARFIGPCISSHALTPLATPDKQYQYDPLTATRLGSMIKEDMSCLSWLDKQEDLSVLFISFGSIGSLPHAQMLEMAHGMEASNHKFLWVARQDHKLNPSDKSPFPEGFLERTKDKGLVISWAPQLQVLNHRAIGGFFTHCGWNSTLESIIMGVPMLCFPMFGDQPINEGTILVGKQHEWMNDSDEDGQTSSGLGLGFDDRRIASVKSDYVVPRGEVEAAVRELFGGDVGFNIRKNATNMKCHARSALISSSHTTLLSFIDDILHTRNS